MFCKQLFLVQGRLPELVKLKMALNISELKYNATLLIINFVHCRLVGFDIESLENWKFFFYYFHGEVYLCFQQLFTFFF